MPLPQANVLPMELPKRKATRIPTYDYASRNYYFITVCTHEKKCIFGTVEQLNPLGKIAMQDLQNLEICYEGVRIDNCIVMRIEEGNQLVSMERVERDEEEDKEIAE